ncbi:Putative pterin-4-alpha-carbinolamine dehydratase [Piscirickettsia salmonis]|uniref:4a-hydroxytetrahydrobiopterin dehydratase n=1 Tax=Piscirickettsia salmonis TaxID=1238 RepID=UPI0012B72310|nr:4a-hydroxytetrahydrobiopterin dehydratase [Piscirickettsia salmonis]QGP51629.1 Putative pterin-4-alpha-carbinolamine dehydratase [Piscirickettsia salmonis]QGP53158.1 Putative pterin-4-alpha-carbinolamine dehydratase [Piscirickettsia salmonis]QGP60905.1 Putative pterin-4-alpha-carbinolamine dehydratase [Piscirickettsia salmonis]QGP62727.1 Putative pterin-4-alpha-carbinolamine dehydratase [Piscirickettsia salmonis]
MKLNQEQIQAALAKLPSWQQEGDKITRTIRFPLYLDGIRFVTQLAEHAEQVQHHPDLAIHWCNIKIDLSTHDVDGISQKDFDMAKYIESALAKFL